mgnify:CR=1 FL=1
MSINDLAKGAAFQREQKQAELLALAKSGVVLPMKIDDIIEIEQRGDVVDLDTGEIIRNGAEQRITVTKLARK